ncbi:hypothetical protein [Solihabitans fulvus]|uniref:hypothetical protein n=1 Tax=Solihabitans fulvus TaxID=1892852 RepID=UPI001661CC55|nr:hypothetical protein [Solihabitans fulvus]
MADTLIAEARQKTRDIDRKLREFFDKADRILSWVPDFLSDLVDPIRAGLIVLRDKVHEFWGKVNQLFDKAGDSDRLKNVGDQWVNQIGNPAGDIAGNLSLDKLKTTVEWHGRAAEAYKAIVPAQVSGLNSIKDLANQMKSSLVNLANAIDNFWIAIIAALVIFVVGAIGAIVAACTVVGLPAAVAALAGAAGLSIGLIIAAVVAMQSFTQTIAIEQGNIKQKIHDDLGDWARTNADLLGHASVNDPDGMNWHINA